MDLLFVRIDLDETKTMQKFTSTWLNIRKILDDKPRLMLLELILLKPIAPHL